MHFGHSFTQQWLLGAENLNFLKTGFQVQISEETIPLLSLCKLQKCEFVKTVKSCAYMLSP